MISIDILNLKIVKEGERKYGDCKINSPDCAGEILRDFIGESDREHFVVLFLDTKNKINAIQTVSIGSLNATVVHPREVFKVAIMKNAASIIVGHNHPSGDPTPSNEDINITNRLVEAGNLLGIKVLDHIIVGDYNLSFKEENLI